MQIWVVCMKGKTKKKKHIVGLVHNRPCLFLDELIFILLRESGGLSLGSQTGIPASK